MTHNTHLLVHLVVSYRSLKFFSYPSSLFLYAPQTGSFQLMCLQVWLIGLSSAWSNLILSLSRKLFISVVLHFSSRIRFLFITSISVLTFCICFNAIFLTSILCPSFPLPWIGTVLVQQAPSLDFLRDSFCYLFVYVCLFCMGHTLFLVCLICSFLGKKKSRNFKLCWSFGNYIIVFLCSVFFNLSQLLLFGVFYLHGYWSLWFAYWSANDWTNFLKHLEVKSKPPYVIVYSWPVCVSWRRPVQSGRKFTALP